MVDQRFSSPGPADFERLLADTGLSEREAQALLSVVLSQTAAEAAGALGVSASTMGSYRQRGYAKLGVSTRAEFMRLPEAETWASTLAAFDVPAKKPVVPVESNPASPQCRPPMSFPCLFVACLLCSTLVIFTGIVAKILLPRHDAYSVQPHGAIASEYGDVPNVVGMRADSAASALASAGFCPEFEPRAGDAASGTILEVGPVGDLSDLAGGIPSISWGDGCTAGYNERGGWDAYVELVVFV
ncbi:helix-turn-helix transcriptional regulator [Thermophilibacter immobilis]|jgi:DNA-binding CsgD family transcriptional regulator|uniref:HTH luxR-type domain-containing protein n=1 Tax=Thermophilibacter immobilis TaxID=2779519 RepID=A0A7S7M9Z8_9ACTN|nr:LuxR C-terminal-related transcriptional regulator [Thermophilibacter immobilis]QOY61430.1 hypothetical protein INP52_04390 [Thermophilibacter immobilis]